MKIISNINIIVYYDAPQLISGKDDGYYIALLYDISKDGDMKYIATHLTEEDYNLLINGEYDLRECILNNDTYLATYDGKLYIEDEIIEPSENMLPDHNFKIK